MNKTTLRIARIALGLTFLGIALMIFRAPAGWGAFIKPWAAALLPVAPAQFMMGVAVFDTIIGLLLLCGVWTWIVALLAALHLASVVVAIGWNSSSVRDIGLFGSALAISVATMPSTVLAKLKGSR